MSDQQQTDEDNATIDRLVEQLNAAAWAEEEAIQALGDVVMASVGRKDADYSEYEARIRDAKSAHQEAQTALAKKIRWFWYKGYRLCRDE